MSPFVCIIAFIMTGRIKVWCQSDHSGTFIVYLHVSIVLWCGRNGMKVPHAFIDRIITGHLSVLLRVRNGLHFNMTQALTRNRTETKDALVSMRPDHMVDTSHSLTSPIVAYMVHWTGSSLIQIILLSFGCSAQSHYLNQSCPPNKTPQGVDS